MHPAFILIPAAALILGPRLWVNHVLRTHNRPDADLSRTAREVARELLDRHGLEDVPVELTDIGDHYDPRARAVRLARDKIDGRSLTAITTAAHEVAHAIQHASGYPPFLWRMRLATVAQVTGQAGTALLLAVPAVSLISRRPLPPMIVGSAALGMLGTGVAAQLAALPTELDASFQRALPMLESGYISDGQVTDARSILTACSLTYVASSLVGVVNIWPWLGRGRVFLVAPAPRGRAPTAAPANPSRRKSAGKRKPSRHSMRGGRFETVVRALARPLIRQWLVASR